MHWQQHYAMELVYQHCERAPRHAATPVWTFAAAAVQQPVLELTALADALDGLMEVLRIPPEAHRASAVVLQQALRQAIYACEVVVAAIQDQGVRVQPGLNALYLLLQEMRRGLRAEERDLQGGPVTSTGWLAQRSTPLPLHRDWVGAKEAALRAGGTLLVVGVLWAWTQASIVGFAMLGLTTMLLVFSAFESPGRTMAFVLRGQLIGAGLALLCQSLLWPLAQTQWQIVWMVCPFAIAAGLVYGHQRTGAGAIDTNMAMFILLAPTFPDTATLGTHLSFALAVVSGPALAWVMFRWIYPTNAQHRMQTLARMMTDEVPALARRLLAEGKPSLWVAQPSVPENQWQAQLHHRLLRLVRWADKTGLPERGQLPHMGLSLRAMQTAMQQLQQWRRQAVLATPALRRTERLAELALHRTVAWGAEPPHEVARHKAQAAWQALAEQSSLPLVLAAQVQRIAQRDLVVLDAVRQALAKPKTKT